MGFEVAGEGSVADLFDPAGILHPVAGVDRRGVADFGKTDEEGFVAEQADGQLGADVAPFVHDVGALYEVSGIVGFARGHAMS